MGNESDNPMEGSSLQLTLPATTTAEDGNRIHSRSDPVTPNAEPPTKRIKMEAVSDHNYGGRVPSGVASEVASVVASVGISPHSDVPDSLNAAPPAPQQTGNDQSAPAEQEDEQEAVNTVAPKKLQALASVKTEESGSSIVTTSSSHSLSRASLNDTATHSAAAAAKSPPADGNQPNAPINPVQPGPNAPAAAAGAPAVPLKSTTMAHLKTKYTGELEYMLREFRKLERQLLGAKGAAQLEESAGSRERREKLHSFILHLEDTVRQIELGCKLEAEGKSTVAIGNVGPVGGDTLANPSAQVPTTSKDDVKKQMVESSALTNLTKEKEEEENVQKLEEHILANLLPVKVRLKKQLAAQQGASRNPAGMPAQRRGMLQPTAAAGGEGTFAAAAEQRRKQAEAARLALQQQQQSAVRRVSDSTQFGKPLGGGGSFLTQKLHGATLGSSQRTHGHGVGSSTTPPESVANTVEERKILYAGMVPGSIQHQSGIETASGAHEMFNEDPNLLQIQAEEKLAGTEQPSNASVASAPVAVRSVEPEPCAAIPKQAPKAATPPARTQQPIPMPVTSSGPTKKAKKPSDNAKLTEEERRKLRRRRRKRKLRRIAKRRERDRQRQIALHQQAQAAQGSSKVAGGRKKAAAGKGQGKKKGPRSVEYICALCSEAYSSTCDYNPWWALAQHECPKCRKSQVSECMSCDFTTMSLRYLTTK
jgi:hypothetical protein